MWDFFSIDRDVVFTCFVNIREVHHRNRAPILDTNHQPFFLHGAFQRIAGKVYSRLTIVVQLNSQPKPLNLPVYGNIRPGDITAWTVVYVSTEQFIQTPLTNNVAAAGIIEG